MRVISLGWGLQSFGLAAMSALGGLPPVDAAIHADTTHERRETYEFAARWTPWLEERGVRVVTVRAKKTAPDEHWGKTLGIRIAAYTTWPDGRPSGTMGRQCTRDWKVAPIRRWLQANRKGKPVELWLGITLDEIQRMRHSDVRYITHRFPFVEDFDPPMSRWQVARWLEENGLEIPVKSACVFCPFHDDGTWREIKMSDNGDWEKAVAVDEAVRHKRPGYVCYVHRRRVPLADVDLRDERDHGQLSFFDDVCDEGYCFL